MYARQGVVKRRGPCFTAESSVCLFGICLGKCLNLFDYASAGASVVSVSAVSAASASAFAAASAAFLSATF